MIKFERLPVDVLLRLDGIKKILIEDDNIIFAYLFGGLAKDKEPFSRHAFESLHLREFFDFRIKENSLLLRRYGLGKE
jgi:predicted nucleotidyltransferase